MNAASQIILHPTVSHSLKFWATTLGRDKTYRAIQYFARFLAWFLIKRGYKDQAARWNALKSALASGRKLMRLFKPMENLQAALKASQSPAIKTLPLEQFATIGRQLGYAGYLSLDAIVWLNSIKFLRLPADRANKVNIASQRFWLAGIVYSVIASALKLNRLTLQAKAIKSSTIKEKDSSVGSVGEEAEKRIKLKTIAIERSATRTQLILDVLDFFLPASNLGYVNINDGVAGIIGVITSLMAFNTHWNAVGSSPK